MCQHWQHVGCFYLRCAVLWFSSPPRACCTAIHHKQIIVQTTRDTFRKSLSFVLEVNNMNSEYKCVPWDEQETATCSRNRKLWEGSKSCLLRHEKTVAVFIDSLSRALFGDVWERVVLLIELKPKITVMMLHWDTVLTLSLWSDVSFGNSRFKDSQDLLCLSLLLS